MTETLAPISARAAIRDVCDELTAGFNFERYGVPIDALDLEHFRKALGIITLLRDAQDSPHVEIVGALTSLADAYSFIASRVDGSLVDEAALDNARAVVAKVTA